MKWTLIFILIVPNAKADELLDVMLRNWNEQIEVIDQSHESHESEDYLSDAEVYHWELGTPDNIPEIEIIYNEPSPCQL